MGYIKEPKGVDFTVINKEMTEEEKIKLSAYILKRKLEIKEMHKRIKTSTSKHKNTVMPDKEN